MDEKSTPCRNEDIGDKDPHHQIGEVANGMHEYPHDESDAAYGAITETIWGFYLEVRNRRVCPTVN